MAKFVIERFVSVPVAIELEADSIDDAIQKHFECGNWDYWDWAKDADYYAENQVNGKIPYPDMANYVYIKNADTGDDNSFPLSDCKMD